MEAYGIRERQISGESIVSETITESWMDRLRELCKYYSLKDIWNMGESGFFFKALPTKGLAKNEKKKKNGERLKHACCFFC